MPIKPPNGPDYYCGNCDLLFRQPLWRRLLGRMPPPITSCPECGRITMLLDY